MSSNNDGGKTVLLAVALLTAGASVGALVSVLLAQKSRDQRRGRAFTNEDTTALAFHIAKLSQQLAQEQNSPRAAPAMPLQHQQHQQHQIPVQAVRVEPATEALAAAGSDGSANPPAAKTLAGPSASAPSSPVEEAAADSGATSQKVAQSSDEGHEDAPKRSYVDRAKAVLERSQEADQYRRNDDVDSLADVLSVYRSQYQSWRKGKHKGAKTTHERLLTRHNRSLSHADPADLPYSLTPGANKDRLATHLWQHLNLGPSVAQKPVKVTVIGGGAFGTSMAAAAARNGHNVVIFVRRREMAREIKLTRRNDQYLPGLELPGNVSATVDLEEALAGTELIIHALPAQRSPAWITEHKHLIPEDVIYCSTAKGLHLDSGSLLSVAMAKAFARPQPFAVLSGPSFAKEIVSEQPTSVVVASKNLADAVKIQRLMSSTSFRVYASQDTVGVELGGALKNPLAIGAGMIEGLGFGINTMSAYVTRACAELTSLAIAMGGKPETVAGLSGVGDLMLTAFGSLSRNRSCGIRLVKGESLAEIQATTTVEGVPTAKVAVAFAEQCNLHLPIFRTVSQILSGRLKPEDFVVTAMMTRPLSMETHVTPLSEVEATAAMAGKQCIL